MRDGLIREEKPVERRLRAEDEIARLNREEAAIALHDGKG